MKRLTVDVIIMTYKPGKEFRYLMEMLLSQSYPVERIIVMNTEKDCFPYAEYNGMGKVEIHHIGKDDFDHGGTRDRGARLSESDLMVYMTQDAVPADNMLITRLVEPFADGQVGAAYARQLPASDCGEIERYTRSYNYPVKDILKSRADIGRMGIKTFFCSNVCAVYRRDLYNSLGGFVKHTIFNEDMIYAAKVIQSGMQVAYVSGARVVHSHNYGCFQQFKRNFDMAVSQRDHPEVFAHIRSETEGFKLVKMTARHLIKKRKPWLIAQLVLQSGFKYTGYRLGLRYEKLPGWIIKKCTMNRSYWK